MEKLYRINLKIKKNAKKSWFNIMKAQSRCINHTLSLVRENGVIKIMKYKNNLKLKHINKWQSKLS